MATIQYNFPTSSVTASNPSVGLNGDTAPLSSTEIGWIDGSGDLQGVSATNPLPMSAASLPLPSGAATSANQTTEITKLTSIDGKIPALGQALMAASTPVTIASNQSAVPVSAASLPLPTGAATSAAQTDGTQKTQIVDGGTGLAATVHNLSSTIVNGDKGLVVQAAMHAKNGSSFYDVACDSSGILAVNVQNYPATQPISGTVSISQATPGTTNGVYVNNASIPVTGTFWQATQPVSGTVAVSSITNALPSGTNTIGYVKGAGLSKANTPVYNSYSSTSVTTSAYVQLIASTTSEADVVQIFDSSGQAMIIATGGAGSEVDQIYVPPGGTDFNLYIAAGTRVSIKALTGTASSGYLLVNLLG